MRRKSPLTLEAMEQVLAQEGWEPQRVGDKLAYRSQFAMPNGPLTCQTEFNPDQDEFIVTVPLSVQVPPAGQTAVVEFINRVNLGILTGGFEMDFTHDTIRFKQGTSFNNTYFLPQLLRTACIQAVQTTDLYVPGFTALLSGNLTPNQALQSIIGAS